MYICIDHFISIQGFIIEILNIFQHSPFIAYPLLNPNLRNVSFVLLTPFRSVKYVTDRIQADRLL